jgi:hypothetical protein
MRRNAGGKACSVLVVATLCLFAQSSREEYRAAYRAWRDAEPNLELDAVAGGNGLAPRASRAAAEEAKYSAAYSAFLRQLAGEYGPSALSLQTALPAMPPSPAPAAPLLRFVAAGTTSVNANISAFANDTDPAIRPLQQALERERSALSALSSAIVDRQKTEERATLAMNLMEQRRTNAIEQYQAVVTAITASADAVDREAAAWPAYYQKLAEAARTPLAPAAPVLSSTLNTANPANPAPPAAAPAAPPAAPITPLPLARYTGAWTYSTVEGMFHGAEPEFAELVVHEQNGRATGTFYARFKLPSGSTGDPQVRFEFSGSFRATRNQTFPLETSDGSKGTIDLIPGNAFNLLEVNFEMPIKPGRIHLGDLLLVKK